MNIKNVVLKIMDIIGAFFLVLGVLYFVQYVFYVINIQTPLVNFLSNFSIFEDFVSLFYSGNIELNGMTYSNSYFITAIFLIIIGFLFTYVERYVETFFECLDNMSNIRKIRRANNYSKRIVREQKTNNTPYKYFLITLKLAFKRANLSDDDIKKMRNDSYETIKTSLLALFRMKVLFDKDKLIFICGDFNKIDEILTEFVRSVRMISSKNTVNRIETTMYSVLDVLEEPNLSQQEIDFIEKIINYGYSNKIITTVLFSEKYLSDIDSKYETETMGTVRIYKDNDIYKINFDDDVEGSEYKDYELYTLKRKK